MNKFDIQNGFRKWAKENTGLSENTIDLYNSVISRYFRLHSDLSQESIDSFIITVTRASSSPYVRAALRRMLEMARRNDLVINMARSIRHERKKMVILFRAHEIERIIKEIEKPGYRLLAMIQRDTGARASDVLSLSTDHINRDEDGTTMLMLRVKGRRTIVVSIKPSTAAELEGFCGSREGMVFVKHDNKLKIRNEYKYYRLALMKAASSTGHPSFRSHDFRRDLINRADKAGYKLKDIQKLVGHSSVITTEKYMAESGLERKEMLQKIWEDG